MKKRSAGGKKNSHAIPLPPDFSPDDAPVTRASFPVRAMVVDTEVADVIDAPRAAGILRAVSTFSSRPADCIHVTSQTRIVHDTAGG